MDEMGGRWAKGDGKGSARQVRQVRQGAVRQEVHGEQEREREWANDSEGLRAREMERARCGCVRWRWREVMYILCDVYTCDVYMCDVYM